jgi:hypothetical protein
MAPARRIEVEDVNTPGRVSRLVAEKYQATRRVLLKALPNAPPGLTPSEMRQAVQPHLPQALWPGGAKAQVVRDGAARPLRWRRT